MTRFDYPPRMVPLTMARQNDHVTFARVYPEHHDWLCEHNISFLPTCYYWPEMLANVLLHTAVGQTVCELRLEVDADHADCFSLFSDLKSFVDDPSSNPRNDID